VTWSPQFHDSLKKGNLKRLDLDVFFRLSTPTAQRMYRFLDKRFYTSPVVAMDLVEFACGHIGLTESSNVAILKRRLAPAITELEGIRFIASAEPSERYRKVKPGVWRVEFKSGAGELADKSESDNRTTPAPEAAESPPSPSAGSLAAEYYRLWDPATPTVPGVRDLLVASELLKLHGPEAAGDVVACLVQVTRKEWPDCRSLSGAAQKYLADALKLHRSRIRRETARDEAETRRQQGQAEALARKEEERRRLEAWNALLPLEQEAIRQTVLASLGGAAAPETFVRRLCIEEAERRRGNE
jgi:hypothetical protein